jgi:tetratricopeptide (TPR) repeat protein
MPIPNPQSLIPPKSQILLALAITLLWAVHPLQTESVTYIVQRAESLCGLFYLLTLYCFIRGATMDRDWGLEIRDWQERRLADSNPQSPIPDPFFWYFAAVLACLLGMATKEIMLTAPVIVLLYDRTFLAGSFAGALRHRQGLYLGLAGTWCLLIYLVLVTGMLSWGAEAGIPTTWAYLLTEPKAIVHYFRAAVWPYPLCAYYAWPVFASWREICWPLTMVSVCIFVTIWATVKRPSLGFLGAWFFVLLAPTSSVIPTRDVVVEHRMYLPLASILTLLVLGVYAVGRWMVLSGRIRAGGAGALAATLLVPLAVPYGMLTVWRNQVYHDAFDVWQDTVAKSPNNAYAQNNLGVALAGRKQLGSAVVHYRRALELKPNLVEAHTNFANALASQGQIDAAIAEYRQAMALNRGVAEVHMNLGLALFARGQVDEAVVQYQEALEIKPDIAELHNSLGTALAGRGQLDPAIAQYQAALEIDPDCAEAHNNLGLALVARGQVHEALAQYRHALSIKPDYAEAHTNLANALIARGQADDAITHYRATLAIKPDFAEAHTNLAIVLAGRGAFDEAIAHFEKALQIEPDLAVARRGHSATQSEREKLVKTLAQRRQSLRLRPSDPLLLNDLAWMLATNPNASVRNGAEAVELAGQALRLAGDQPALLDTLAAAYAEAGHYADSVKTARSAILLANRQKNLALAEKIADRLKQYEARKPYRQGG